MKTLNSHPQWHNQPLRLSREEKDNPCIALEDFFDTYHLQDVREILWRWLVAVISSPLSISSDPVERSNHIFFYEKTEGLIEAAFVLKRRMRKHRRRKEKRKFKKENQASKAKSVKIEESINLAVSEPVDMEVENEEILNKPKQLIEYVKEAPLYVISEIFRRERFPSLHDQLRDLLYIALSADCSRYEEGEQRKHLLAFHEELHVLVEALSIININNLETNKQTDRVPEVKLLSQEQIANPLQVVSAFFERFPTAYIIRELNDWLEAGLTYAGPYPDNMHELQALLTYRNVLCLLQSAEQLLLETNK